MFIVWERKIYNFFNNFYVFKNPKRRVPALCPTVTNLFTSKTIQYNNIKRLFFTCMVIYCTTVEPIAYMLLQTMQLTGLDASLPPVPVEGLYLQIPDALRNILNKVCTGITNRILNLDTCL